MSKGFMKSALMPLLVTSCAILLLAGCKKKEETAVVEEVPAVVAPKETDTTATLLEEPALKQVGKGAKASKGKKGKGAKGAGNEMAVAAEPKTKGKKSHEAPVSSASADKAGFSESGHFVVQVNVFKNKSQAAKLVEKLAAAGYPAYVAEVETPVPSMPGTYHRVRVGNFARVADAKAFGENTLTPMGYSFWVDNKKNDAVGGDGSGSTAAPSSYTPEATPAAAESTPEPKAHKGKRKKSKTKTDESGMSSTPSDMSMPSTPSTPSEPAVPTNDSWGSPKSESSVPKSEPTSTPRMEEKSPETSSFSTPTPASEPVSKPAAKAKSSESSSAPSSTSTPKSPSDTGKVNLDEW